jgi:chromosome segregation ATPase
MSKLFSSRRRDIRRVAQRNCAEETLIYDSEVIRLRAFRREAATKFAALRDEFKRVQSRLARAEIENSKLREEIALASAKALEAVVNMGKAAALEDAQVRISSLESEVSNGKRRIRVLERFEMKAAVYEKALASTKVKNHELENALQQAREKIKKLENELTAAENRSSQEFRKVGLHEDCPDFVLKAVRKTYRKELHPDPKPIHLKSEAEKRFKDAEAVFHRLYALRGL